MLHRGGYGALRDWPDLFEDTRELYEKAAAIGLLGLGFPEAYGGTPADQFMWIVATQELARAGAGGVDAGKRVGAAPSMCKLMASEMVGRVADRTVQVFGGQGLIRGFPVERMYRDVRHYRIGEGSSEVQRMLISRDVLKRVS